MPRYPTLSQSTRCPYSISSVLGPEFKKAVKIPMMFNEDQEFYEAEQVFDKSPEIIDISDDESLGEIITNESILMKINERREKEEKVRDIIFQRRLEENKRREAEDLLYESAMTWWRQMENSNKRTEFFLSFDIKYEEQKDLRIKEDLIRMDEDQDMDLEERLRALEDLVYFQ
jgi:hypothetical protein